MNKYRGSRPKRRKSRRRVTDKFILIVFLLSVLVVGSILFFIFVHFDGTYDEDDGIIAVGPFTEIVSKECGTKVYIIHDGDGKPYREKISLPYDTGIRIVTEIAIEEGSIELD